MLLIPPLLEVGQHPSGPLIEVPSIPLCRGVSFPVYDIQGWGTQLLWANGVLCSEYVFDVPNLHKIYSILWFG